MCIGFKVVVDGDAIGGHQLVSLGNGFVSSIRIGLRKGCPIDVFQGITCAVVHDDVASVMVLVKAFVDVVHSYAAIEHYVHGSLVRTAFKSVAVTFCYNSVYERILVCQTVFEHDGDVVFEATVFLKEHVIAVVRVVIGATTIEIVTCSDRNFGCKAVCIAVTFVFVLVSVTVENVVIGTEILYLNARIAVFVELTVLYDVVVGVLCAVDNVLLGATGGFVAFYEQSVVACVGDIHMIEVPVRRG